MINLIVIQSLDKSEKVKSGEEVFQSCKDSCILSNDSYIVLPNNKSDFLIALSTAIDKCISSKEDWIIHIDAHSYNQAEDQAFSCGVSIAGQDLDNELSWEKLHSELSRLSEKTKGKVILSLAMCYSQDFLPLIKKCPIAVIDSIITTTVKIESKPLILGFNALYQKYSKCHEIKRSFEYGMQRFVTESDQCMFKLAQANMFALQQETTLQGGKYIIKKVLGQGGFGITYLAEHDLLGTDVAIKEFFIRDFCNRDSDTSQVIVSTDGAREQVARFKNKFIKEARNIAKLHHPNIVRISDVFEENGTAYYVMDYCEGGSLADLIKQHPSGINEELALKYIRQIASALSCVHEHKMMHMDVKPANIMLDAKGDAVLIDFGISKNYSDDTTSLVIGASVGYSPIEQYTGIKEFSPQSDIYSLGATLYKLITGQTPPNPQEIDEHGVPTLSASSPIVSAIHAAMQYKRINRPESIAEWLKILDNAKVESDEDTIRLINTEKEDQEEQVEEEKKKPENVAEAKDNYQRLELKVSSNYDNETLSVSESNKSSVTNQAINNSLRNNISQYNYIQTNKDNSFIAFYKRNIDGTFLESIGALILFVIIMIAFASISYFVVLLVFFIFDIEFSKDKCAFGKIEYDIIASGFIAIVSSALLILIEKFLGKVDV
ncbi:MAG: serine/threonine protein kinase [Prevotellaceae bacterium]|nr:serine/threonine protein kinase [Candidatus Colivivens equi]